MSRLHSILAEEVVEPELTEVGVALEDIASNQTEPKHIYILLTDTQTRFSRISKALTHQPYNHASIAFDESLEALYTYALVNRNGWKGGLKKESSDSLKGARFSLYQLPVTQDIWDQVKGKVETMEENVVGTSYNHLALLNFVFDRELFKNNNTSKLFCSQFIVNVLSEAGVGLFHNRDSASIKPYDFVRSKLLRFVRRGTFR